MGVMAKVVVDHVRREKKERKKERKNEKEMRREGKINKKKREERRRNEWINHSSCLKWFDDSEHEYARPTLKGYLAD